MSQRILTVSVDLSHPLVVHPIPGIMGGGDRYADIIRVLVYQNGEQVTLSGTVTGYVMNRAGDTFVIDGVCSGNGAQVQLIEEVYELPGPITIAVRLVNGDVKTTLAICSTAVKMTATTTVYDPGDIVPDLDDVRARLAEVVAATNAANSAAAFYPMTYAGPVSFPEGEQEYYAIGNWSAGEVIPAKASGANTHYVIELGGLIEGETFTITARDGSTAQPWGIIDKDRRALAWAGTDLVTNRVITVPEGGTGGTLIVQVGNSSISSAKVIRNRNLTAFEQRIDHYDSAFEQIATTFDSGTAYVAGQMVYYNGMLYRFTTNHAAGAWTGADASRVILSDEIGGIKSEVNSLKDAVDDYNTLLYYKANLSSSETSRGVTFAWSGSECHVSGTTTGSSSGSGNHTFYNQSGLLPYGIKAGETCFVNYESEYVTFKIYPYVNGSLGSSIFASKTSGQVTFPANLTGLFFRLDADWGCNIDETVEPIITNQKPAEDYGDRVEALEDSVQGLTGDVADLEASIGEQKAVLNNAFHQYNFLACDYVTGYYDASGNRQGTSSGWKTYFVPLSNKDRYFFFNRPISLAVFNANKEYISGLDPVVVENAIIGVSATVSMRRVDISQYTSAAYIGIPRNGDNLTCLFSSMLPDVIPMFPYSSDSSCKDREIVIANGSVINGDGYRKPQFIGKGFMSITTGEMLSSTSNYCSDFVLIKKGTTFSTKNTPYRMKFRGQTAKGTTYISGTDEITFTEDFWGTIDYSADASWAWSDFAPQNFGLDEAQAFVTMILPEDRDANQWTGKSWYCYGTSISDIGANDAAGNNGHSGKYPLYLDAVTGMTRTNGAIGSGGIRTNASHQGNVLTALLTTPFDVDLVTLETLPNDGVDDPANVGEITDTGTTTICGAFKTAVEYILNNTRAKFVLIFVGGYAAGTDAMNSAHMGYIGAKDKLKKIAECYGVPVIDAEKEAADWKHRKSGVLLADSIHPNYLGGFVYGKYIWQKLKEIAPNPIYQQST